MYDTMIGIDLAKNVFVLHGASMTGEVKFRKKIGRGQFLRFMEAQPPCVAVMESCGSAHFWARELVKFGHAVKLIAPQYVRPFVKRQKNDAADAEAIVAAAQRPEMRFVDQRRKLSKQERSYSVHASASSTSAPNWSMLCVPRSTNSVMSFRWGSVM